MTTAQNFSDHNDPNGLASYLENVKAAPQDSSSSSDTFDGQSRVSGPYSLNPRQEVSYSSGDVSQLRDQLNRVSLRLAETQDQVDKLLEEKRSWLQSGNQATNPSAVGELRGRWLQAKSLADTYKREKENMVMKYAQAEQKRINLEKRVCELEQKCQKTVAGQSPSDHAPPVGSIEEVSEKYPAEIRESHQRFAQTEKALISAREELALLKKANVSAEARIGELEKRISQTSELLREEQQKVSSQNLTITRLNRSLDAATKEAKDAQRLREREAERLCAEAAYQEAQEKLRHLTTDNELLKQELNKMEALKQEMEQCQSQLSEVLTENATIPELRSELQTLQQQETRLSVLTRSLTEQNVELQANRLAAENRLRELEDCLQAQEQLLRTTTEDSEKTIASERNRAQDLERQLHELQLQTETLRERESRLLADLETEREQAGAMRKRDAGRIRDLARQLARVSHSSRRASSQLAVADNSDAGQSVLERATDIPSMVDEQADKSGASSVYSVELSTGPAELLPEARSAPVVGNILMATGETNHTPSSVNGDSQSMIDTDHFDESERTAWLAKIDRLQQSQLRLTDKVEFLQEHCCQLTEELSYKSRIIQSLLVGDRQTGSSSSLPDPDCNRAAQPGSFLSSLYLGKAGRDAPDLDTCLEINQKLQVVLQDTLLRNVVFKDNLSTLGSEISRLTKMLEDIQELVCESCHNVIKELGRSGTIILND